MRFLRMNRPALACPAAESVYSTAAMNKPLITHACWALAAAAAFMIGSRQGAGVASASGDASQKPGSARITASVSGDAADARATRGAARSKEPGVANSALTGLFGSIASGLRNPDALAEQAFRDPNPITRRLAFSRLLESLTPENAEALRSRMVELGADGDQWRDFHYSWGAIAGKAAFDHAAASDEPDLAATMTGWAAANPAEALAMLNNLPETMRGQRDELTASVVSGLTHQDAAMATDLVLKLGGEENPRAGNLMELVASATLRSKGPEQASLWAESLPDGALKGTAMSRVAESYVRKDPAGAARWVQRFAAEDYATRAVERIGGDWAENDPIAAVGWLESLPTGSGQAAGLRNAFGDWEDRDPVAAGQYLLAMPLTPQRDAAISGFATGYAWQNPQVAIAWAQDIRDPALRQSSLTRAGQAFYRRDPAGALAWLETSGLPEEVRQQVAAPENRR
jgi:hypothetical protein